MKKFIIFFILIFLIAFGLSLFQNLQKNNNLTERLSNNKSGESPTTAQRIETVADNLEIPWEIVFLPDNDILLTERAGTLKRISNGSVSVVTKISDVKHYGEGGLMGMAISPDFLSDHYLFLYYTYSGSNDQTRNRVVRYRFENNQLSERKILIDNIPGAIFHNGGRIKFGPDGFLYVTTGDSRNPSLSQNKNSLAGKILKIDEDGNAAPGNPFGNLAYSYGHRNPQGLAWDSRGRLWETEHGPSGEFGLCCRDEVNIIIKGKNYDRNYIISLCWWNISLWGETKI